MDAAAVRLARTVGHLDVLVDDASHPVEVTVLSAFDADVDAVRAALEVDVLDPRRLVQALLPLLLAAPAARVVNVSSVFAQQIAIGLDLGANLCAPAYSFATPAGLQSREPFRGAGEGAPPPTGCGRRGPPRSASAGPVR